MLLLQRYMITEDHCRQNLLPANVVDPQTLLTDLQNLESILPANTLQLAIPVSSLEDYYKAKIAECSYSNSAINIQRKLQNFHPYLPKVQILIGNLHGKRRCESIAIYNTHDKITHVLSAHDLHECNLMITHSCRLPSFPTSNMFTLCLEASFEQKSGRES